MSQKQRFAVFENQSLVRGPFLRDLDLLVERHAGQAAAHAGDIVTTTWVGSWKVPHAVRISEVSAYLTSLRRGDQWTIEPAYGYIAQRFKRSGLPLDGPGGGIVLDRFTTASGVVVECQHRLDNHCLLHWQLETLTEAQAMAPLPKEKE